MTRKIYKAISEFDLIEKNDSIVIGFSGGADSVTLIHFMYNIREEFGLKLIAAHVNHCLRGTDSDNDEKFAEEFCNKLSIPIEILKVDVNQISKDRGCGIEECARDVRYEFFDKLSNKYDAKIATAHTLSDNIETVLLNFTRGAGINGMCGIPPKRGKIIRPLIFSTRDDIEKYCSINNLTYVTDKSNFERKYSRNKIRLDVIPVLKQINPSLEKTVLRTITQLKTDNEYLNSIANDNIKKSYCNGFYSLKYLVCLQEAILSRCIKMIILNECGVNIEKIHVYLIMEKIKIGSGAVTIPSDVCVKIDNGFLYIEKKELSKINYDKWEYNINDIKILTDSKRKFIIEMISKNEYQNLIDTFVDKRDYLVNNAISYDVVKRDTVIRNRRCNDKFKKAGRGVTKSLKKLFNESKVPINQRANIAVIANGNDILWVEGFGVSEFAKIKPETKQILIVSKKE